MNDIEKYKNKKVYIVFDEKGNRKAIGNGKNIYISKAHIKGSLTQQAKYCLHDGIEELIKRFTGYTIRTYELKDTGEEITIEDFIKNEITKTKPYM
jgi:hypothetical protein